MIRQFAVQKWNRWSGDMLMTSDSDSDNDIDYDDNDMSICRTIQDELNIYEYIK